MMNDICIDIDYQQIYKHGQRIGGDVYLLDRSEGTNVITATLSDGLGSGVKANVLASLTTHMANKMSSSPLEISRSAAIIMDTLPVDKEKGISYSTFTIAKILFSEDKSFINVSLVEYDNPESLRFTGSEPVKWDRHASVLNRRNAVKREVIFTSDFSMRPGDRLIFFSDGVAQAGVSLGEIPSPAAPKPAAKPAYYGAKPAAQPVRRKNEIGPMGWGEESVRKFVAGVLEKRPEISSRQLAREIVTQAYKFDNYKANDDITCVSIYVRKQRRTLIVTGAPRSKESDKKLGDMIRSFDGKVIVCGGTTSKIVARELGKQIKSDRQPSGSLPPSSLIEGIDLVTEGMLTLSAVSERLTNRVLLKDMPEDPAKRFINILRDTDQVEFVVGTRLNDDTDDPTMVAKIGVRFPLIDQMARAMRQYYLQEVEIQYL